MSRTVPRKAAVARLGMIGVAAMSSVALGAATRGGGGHGRAAEPQRPHPALSAARSLQRQLARDFHHPFHVRQGRNFIEIYDTTPLFASQRMTYLQEAHASFYDYFNLRLIHARPLPHRLLVLLFKQRKNFLSYARNVDHADMAWAAGYYSQRTNRVAFYDDSTGRSAMAVDKLDRQLRKSLRTLARRERSATLNREPDLAAALARQRSATARKLLFINNYAHFALQRINRAKTIHEACHELSFNSGIQKRGVDYPFWLSEGLATSFEETDSPARINRGRLAVFLKARNSHQMIPLKTLISRQPGAHVTIATLSTYYGESWALFYYFYGHDRRSLEKLLLLYRRQIPGRIIPPKRQLAFFQRCFGDHLARLNRRWLRTFKRY